MVAPHLRLKKTILYRMMALLCIFSLLVPIVALPGVSFAEGEGEEEWQMPGAVTGEINLRNIDDRSNYRLELTQLTGEEPLFASDYTWDVESDEAFQFYELQPGEYRLELFYKEDSRQVYQLNLASGETSHVVFYPDRGGTGIIQGSVAFDGDSRREPFRMGLYSSAADLNLNLDLDYTFQSYAFVGLPEGRYNMSANYKRMQQQRNNLVLSAGQVLNADYKFYEQPVEGGYNLAGRLTTTISGQWVSSIYLIHNGATWLVNLDDTGYYSVNDIPAGRYTLVVYSSNPSLDYTIQDFEIDKVHTEFNYQYMGHSPEGTGTLHGRVIDPEGGSLNNKQFWLKRIKDDFSYLPGSYSWGGITDGEGSFMMYGLEPGVYELSAGDGMVRGETNVQITSDTESYRNVRTAPFSSAKYIQGTIKSLDGTARIGVPVRLYSSVRDEQEELLNETRSTGQGYIFNYLNPGRYILKAEIDGVEAVRNVELLPDEPGKIVDFDNKAPVVSRVYVEGSYLIGSSLTATGVGYYDEENDEEDTPEYQWVRAESTESDYIPIEGAADRTYIIRPEDAGRYISVLYTPKAKTGTIRGEAVKGPSQIVEDLSVLSTSGREAVQGVPFDLEIEEARDFLGASIEGEHQVQVWQGDTLIVDQEVNFEAGTGVVRGLVIQQLDVHQFFIQVLGATTRKPLELILTENQPPTGEVRVVYKGTPTPGSILTAQVDYFDPEGDPAGEHEYQWLVYSAYPPESQGEEPPYLLIPGEEQASYEVRPQDIGKYIGVRVKPVALTGATEGGLIYSQPVQIEDLSAIGSIKPSHEPVAGEAFDLVLDGIQGYSGQRLNGNYTVILSSHHEEIRRAEVVFEEGSGVYTGLTFDFPQTYQLKLEILDQTREFPFEIEVAPVNQPPAGYAEISGSPFPGRLLTGQLYYEDPENDPEGDHEYQWLKAEPDSNEFTPIEGAAGSTYNIREEDAGSLIKLRIIPRAAAGAPEGEAVYSEAIEIEDHSEIASIQPVGRPEAGVPFQLAISGAREYSGELLNGQHAVQFTSSLEGQHESFLVNFNAGEAVIPAITYQAAGEYFALLKVVDRVKLTGFSLIVAKPNQPPTGTVSIAGSATPGSRLAAVFEWQDEDGDEPGELEYQWQIGGTLEHPEFDPIVGATSDSYQVAIRDVGKHIRVRVKPKAASGVPEGEYVYSKTVEIKDLSDIESIQPVNQPFAGKPFALILNGVKGYNGELLIGLYTVKVKNGDVELASQELAFAEGSAAIQEVVLQTPGEQTIIVEIVQAASPKTVIITVSKVIQPPTGSLSVLGNPVPGSSLMAQAVYSSDNEEPEGKHSYQWLRSVNGESFESIAAASTAEYNIQPEDAGYYIRAEVVFRTNDGVESKPVASTPVYITNANQVVTGVSFIDTDARAGIVSGVIRWNGIVDESGITGYTAYFADKDKQRIGNSLGTAAKGSGNHIALNKVQLPAGAVYIAVFVQTDSGTVSGGMHILAGDRSSIEEIKADLKKYLFPQVPEVRINHIMSAIQNKTDMNGDGVFDKEDARLILSLIGMTS